MAWASPSSSSAVSAVSASWACVRARLSASCASAIDCCAAAIGATSARRTSAPTATPGEADRPLSRRGAVLTPILEVSFNQRDQRLDGRVGIGTFGAKINDGILRRLGGHYLDDAFGINPGTVGGQTEIDARLKPFGELRQLDGRPSVQPDRVSQQH